MHCTCGKSGTAGFAPTYSEDGVQTDLWVCANCKRPTQMVLMKLTDRFAPKNATSIRSVVSDGDGRSMITWGTTVSGEKIVTMNFHAYPRKVDMTQGRNVCVALWEELDNAIDIIREAGNPADLVTEKKVRATTLAEVIALIMSPFYADVNAVLAESMTRWTARQNSTDHESPGLGETIWDPATRFDGTPYAANAEVKAPSSKPRVVFDDTKKTFIKHTLETGQMTPEVLAGMFQCSVEDIKAVVDE